MYFFLTDKKLQLYSTLIEKNAYQQNVMVEFSEPHELPKNEEYIQHIIFLADLRCPDAISSLKMVFVWFSFIFKASN